MPITKGNGKEDSVGGGGTCETKCLSWAHALSKGVIVRDSQINTRDNSKTKRHNSMCKRIVMNYAIPCPSFPCFLEFLVFLLARIPLFF